MLGGSTQCIGDVTAAAEFNMHFDPSSASSVFRSPTTKALIPLEATNQVVFDINMLGMLPAKNTRAGELLHSMLPHLFRTYRQHRAQEAITLQAAIGIVYLVEPILFQSEQYSVDIEVLGELTRGATIVDRRPFATSRRDLEIVTTVDADAVRECVYNGLKFAGQCTGGI